ncbi:tyrosine-type recombinase/integrase [Marivirga harenae]|uniref:tyrosine-type recombinase/integrase n=1 Tax=Marivirga harenae TaxID=2010992 RepID=UPI0026E0B3D9|nr:tyrosine-type recombinase/integrase [Marivirga harenae]WKV13381.1 tyrosine-type recombinase/integrase [Marivirga harenae]|tara:strand:+ start:211875 stop:212756 length:882 start_codon:yes stop_codon:yes gene_type:complete
MLNTFWKYLEFEKRYSRHTLASYQNDINQFVRFLESQYQVHNLLKAEHRHIRAWIVALMQEQINPKSINRKIISLRTFYKFAISREGIKQNPTQKIKALKTSKELPQFVQEKEMDNLLSIIEFADDFEGSRDALIMELLYGTGIRLSELLGLKYSDFNMQAKTIRVLGKGNKERIIPFHNKILSRLNSYISHKNKTFSGNGNIALIVSNNGNEAYPMMINRITKKYLNQVTTISKTSPHILRHTFATHLLNKGADLNAVKDLLGHSSLAATQVYTHNSLDKLKKVFDQAHPKA